VKSAITFIVRYSYCKRQEPETINLSLFARFVFSPASPVTPTLPLSLTWSVLVMYMLCSPQLPSKCSQHFTYSPICVRIDALSEPSSTLCPCFAFHRSRGVHVASMSKSFISSADKQILLLADVQYMKKKNYRRSIPSSRCLLTRIPSLTHRKTTRLGRTPISSDRKSRVFFHSKIYYFATRKFRCKN